MAVREHDAVESFSVLAQPCEVGQVHLGDVATTTRKHLPAVDEQNSIIMFDRHAVATHTTEPTKNYDTNGFGHCPTVLSRVLASAFAHYWPVHVNV